jgi:HNH endonuclease
MRPHCKPLPQLTQSDIERFWKHVDKSGEHWLWKAFKSPEGYGIIGIAKRTYIVSRISWLIHTGEDPGDMLVLHSCDIPPCVRFEHLFLGTDSVNKMDSTRKGRNKFPRNIGEENPHARLTEAQVREIRQIYNPSVRLSVLAKKYGVTKSAIHEVTKGRVWKHILP